MTGRREEGERGVSMIELIVGMGLVAVVALLASQMLIIGWQTQGSVTTRTRSLANGQVASELIDRAVRRASAFSALSAGDLKVCFGDGSWARFTLVSTSLRYATSSKPAGSEVAGSVAEATFTKTGQQLDYHLAFARPDLTKDATIDSSVVQRGPASGSCTA